MSIADELLDLLPWQRRLAAALLAGEMVTGGKRNGKRFVKRAIVNAHLARGEHVHLALPGELWCATLQPAGALWQRLK
jgi:hypothetical protein